jgi:CRP-like cAMP-binding protein
MESMEAATLMKSIPVNGGTTRDRRLIEGVIASLPPFRQLVPRYVAEVASHARTWSVRRGATICERDTNLPGVLAVAYGMVKLSVARANGEERVVRLVNPGETFGEASALFGRPCTVDAGALTDSLLIVIPSAPLLRLLEKDPGFAHRMVGILAERVQTLIRELESSVRHRGPQRLASYLHSLARPGEAAGSWLVSLPASKTVIASRLGFSKETLSRLLRKFVDQGVIESAHRQIAILDPERLAQMAREGG